MSNDGVVFVDDLPPSGNADRRGWDALTENPGVWAEYWGRVTSVHTTAKRTHRDGFRFEAAVRGAKPYVRAVKL